MATTPKRIEARIRFEEDTELYRLTFSALGTDCSILFHSLSNPQAAAYAKTAAQWVADFETRYSRFLPGSLVSKIGRAAGKHPVMINDEDNRLFDICSSVYESTGGLVDVTARPLLNLWDYRKTPCKVPSESQIEEARALVGWELVERTSNSIFLPKPGMRLDLGGIGKEYAVDRVVELSGTLGIDAILVDFGGDIRCEGAPPKRDRWQIGIEDPSTLTASSESLFLKAGAVASSGNYRRSFSINNRTFSHIINPRSGRAVERSKQISTVVSDTCLRAGILATTACMLTLEQAISEIEEAYQTEGRIFQDNKTAATKGFYDYTLQTQ